MEAAPISLGFEEIKSQIEAVGMDTVEGDSSQINQFIQFDEGIIEPPAFWDSRYEPGQVLIDIQEMNLEAQMGGYRLFIVFEKQEGQITNVTAYKIAKRQAA